VKADESYLGCHIHVDTLVFVHIGLTGESASLVVYYKSKARAKESI
jgi:hypothetical protein